MRSSKVLAFSSLAVAAAAVPLSPARAGTVNVVGLNLQQIDAGLTAGTFTSVDLVKAYLARIDQFNPGYNAFIFRTSPATLLAQAAAADAARKAGGQVDPLAGVPVVVKNSIDVAGVPTTDGTALFDSRKGGIDLIPTTDAPVVARLKASGAIILGETNAPDFSASYNTVSSVQGQTLNTYNKTLVPGGSSGGTATAVSGSFAVVGLGEETAGSIQVPSDAQSLVGIKPTFGLVPNSGLLPLASSARDVIGPIARDVYTAAATLDVIAGADPSDPKTAGDAAHIPAGGYTAGLSAAGLQGKRIGLFGSGFKDVSLSPETASLYATSVKELQSLGATTVADPFQGSGYAKIFNAANALEGLESGAFDLNNYLKRLGTGTTAASLAAEYKSKTGNDLFSQSLFPLLLGKNPDFLSTPNLATFTALKDAALTLFLKVMDSNNLSALAFPEAYAEVPTIAQYNSPSGGSYPATAIPDVNIEGLPAVTVPAGYYKDGSPFGLIFVGRPFAEKELIDDAYAFQQGTQARIEPNLIPLPPALWAGLSAAPAVWLASRRRRTA